MSELVIRKIPFAGELLFSQAVLSISLQCGVYTTSIASGLSKKQAAQSMRLKYIFNIRGSCSRRKERKKKNDPSDGYHVPLQILQLGYNIPSKPNRPSPRLALFWRFVRHNSHDLVQAAHALRRPIDKPFPPALDPLHLFGQLTLILS